MLDALFMSLARAFARAHRKEEAHNASADACSARTGSGRGRWGQIVTPDGVHGSTFLFLVGDDTAYAPGFTESRFAWVHVGESGAEVRRVLGEPLDVIAVTEARLETWHYTRSPDDRHYRLRAVVLEGGIVVDKLSEAYVD